MRSGEALETVSLPPEAPATNDTTERDRDQAPRPKYSRELKGITDRRHFQQHPQHDSVFAYRSATASRSTSVAPAAARRSKTRGTTSTDIGGDLEVVPETSSNDEESAHDADLHHTSRAVYCVTGPRQTIVGRGKGKMKNLPKSGPEGRGVMEEEVRQISDDDDQDNGREIPAVRGERCTRSQLGRTAPPEVSDARALCTECKIRARTTGAQDCGRYASRLRFRAQLTTVRCRRHAQIYGLPWPNRYRPPSLTLNHRNRLKRKREDGPVTSCPTKRTRTEGPAGAAPRSKRIKKSDI
jgi:hypothetical protein